MDKNRVMDFCGDFAAILRQKLYLGCPDGLEPSTFRTTI